MFTKGKSEVVDYRRWLVHKLAVGGLVYNLRNAAGSLYLYRVLRLKWMSTKWKSGWMSTKGKSEVVDYYRRWLVRKLAVGV